MQAVEHKRHMKEKFGEDAFISLDFEEVLIFYVPVNIEIPFEKFKVARDLE